MPEFLNDIHKSIRHHYDNNQFIFRQSSNIQIMLALNSHLEQLNQTLQRTLNLQACFAQVEPNELLEVAGRLDKEQKGHLYTTQLMLSDCKKKGFQDYIQTVFPYRITPTLITTKLLENPKPASFTNILESRKVSSAQIQEFFTLQFESSILKKQVLQQIGTYVLSKDGEVTEKDFEKFCSMINLPINSSAVFDFLAEGGCTIEVVNYRRQYVREDNQFGKPIHIEKLDSLLSRLEGRVIKFGAEWLFFEE